jgi:D-citramalate synthase
MESKEYQHINLKKCDINTGLDVGSTVSIRVIIDEEEFQGSGAGNGGFDAFMDGIGKILQQKEFQMPLLTDYEVHIPRGGKTDALTECIITWQSDEREFKTRGVDSNQVMAGVKATMRMINIMLHAQAASTS